MSARAGDFDEHISWGISMEQLVMKAGGWFALALLAAAAAVMAADSGFAVHMTIVAATGLLLEIGRAHV